MASTKTKPKGNIKTRIAMENTEKKIIVAGFGGQGVVLTGYLMQQACVVENKNVTGMVSYGAEMRGGTANTTVVISDEEIASPFVVNPDIAVIFNQPSLDKFEELVKPGGMIFINTSLVSREVERTDLEVVKINATEIAHQIGNVRAANMVALGAFTGKTKLLKQESVSKAVEDFFSKKSQKLVDLNIMALRQGAESFVD